MERLKILNLEEFAGHSHTPCYTELINLETEIQLGNNPYLNFRSPAQYERLSISSMKKALSKII